MFIFSILIWTLGVHWKDFKVEALLVLPYSSALRFSFVLIPFSGSLVAETFSNYFSKYGEITDSVIMLDKQSGRPRGFGFVTFVDSAVVDKVLEKVHVIDGRTVRIKPLVFDE